MMNADNPMNTATGCTHHRSRRAVSPKRRTTGKSILASAMQALSPERRSELKSPVCDWWDCERGATRCQRTNQRRMREAVATLPEARFIELGILLKNDCF